MTPRKSPKRSKLPLPRNPFVKDMPKGGAMRHRLDKRVDQKEKKQTQEESDFLEEEEFDND